MKPKRTKKKGREAGYNDKYKKLQEYLKKVEEERKTEGTKQQPGKT